METKGTSSQKEDCNIMKGNERQCFKKEIIISTINCCIEDKYSKQPQLW